MAANARTIRSVALPTEHGCRGFLAEPILPGVLVAPSWAGLLLSLAALGVFLLHQPLKYTIKAYVSQLLFQVYRNRLIIKYVCEWETHPAI